MAHSSHGFHSYFTRKCHTHAKFTEHGKQRKAVGSVLKHLACFSTSSWDLNKKSSELRMHFRSSTEIQLSCDWKRQKMKHQIFHSGLAKSIWAFSNWWECASWRVQNTVYLFCRRQKSCHPRRFLEQPLSLFQDWVNFGEHLLFFIRLWWALVTFFNWKRRKQLRVFQLRGTPFQRERLWNMFMVRYCVITQENVTAAVFSCNSLKSFFFFNSTLGDPVSSRQEFQIQH